MELAFFSEDKQFLFRRSGSKLFTGEEYDADLGLYQLRARYHNPGTGRFWTRDSFEGFASDPGSQHPYSYAQNNPVNRVDPSGHMMLGEMMMGNSIANLMQPALDQAWKGVMNYSHGLGGGSALKAANGAEGLFIQGLSQHVGINLGQAEFYAPMKGAPYLLAANPFVFTRKGEMGAWY